MQHRRWRTLSLSLAIGVLLLASCGEPDTLSPQGQEQELSPVVATIAPTLTTAPQPTAEEEPTAAAECEEPAAEISIGAPFQSEIVGRDQPPPEKKYFCVIIPAGVNGITFEITATTADLNLFVGHPDLQTVQEGGAWFWFTDQRGAEDKAITVEPALEDHVRAGPYYIEVSPQDFRESSPFTLLVSTR